jgi:dTDP-4-dehydrorhamnose reductase
MLIWLTGASGMLGRYVGARLDDLRVAWVGTDVDLDIADESAVAEFARRNSPTALINCAAYTAVDAAEADEASALRVNAVGPAVLAQQCSRLTATFVHVSTDYVFDGELEGHLQEDSPLGPCNAYGRTKLEGERRIASAFEGAANGRWLVIRTSWLFGPGRTSFVDTMWKLMLQKPELRVVDDQWGRPTYASDLADLLVRAATETKPDNGIWHFANSEPTTWYGFACAIREQLLRVGVPVVTEKIVPVASSEYPRPARRPRNSVLSTQRLETRAGITPRPWRNALRDYIERRLNSEVDVGNS